MTSHGFMLLAAGRFSPSQSSFPMRSAENGAICSFRHRQDDAEMGPWHRHAFPSGTASPRHDLLVRVRASSAESDERI